MGKGMNFPPGIAGIYLTTNGRTIFCPATYNPFWVDTGKEVAHDLLPRIEARCREVIQDRLGLTSSEPSANNPSG